MSTHSQLLYLFSVFYPPKIRSYFGENNSTTSLFLLNKALFQTQNINLSTVSQTINRNLPISCKNRSGKYGFQSLSILFRLFIGQKHVYLTISKIKTVRKNFAAVTDLISLNNSKSYPVIGTVIDTDSCV